MDLTADEAAAIRFRGTRYAYDRLEVDRFRTRVIATLEAYEQALAEADRRIARLEKLQPRGVARRLPPEPVPVTTVPTTTESDVPEGLDRFESWVTRRRAEFEIEYVVSQAREEARMIRALAAEQAAAEIARLTDGARQDALEVTSRAARLASDTEDAAHRRAGEIIDAAAGRSESGAADMDELSRRIIGLRSSIAAVQDRLDALAGEGTPTAPRTDVIDLDLVDPGASRNAKRGRKRAGVAAGTEGGGADELEDRVAKLRERLENH